METKSKINKLHEHLQHFLISPDASTLFIKGKSGDEVGIAIKNVVFWNSTLVTYTYIYVKENQYLFTQDFSVGFTWIMGEKEKEHNLNQENGSCSLDVMQL